METQTGEQQVEFDLKEVLNGTVESVSEKLAGMTRADVVQLHGLEAAGAKRTTLLAAIDADLKRRDDAEDEKAVEQAEARFTQADIDAAVNRAKADAVAEHVEQQGATISASEHMRLMAEKDAAHANALAAAKAAAANKPAPKPKPAPGAKRMAIDAKADAPGLVALTGATKVQFVDDRDMTLLHLPVLDFVPAQFVPMGEAVKLTVDIEFPTTLTGSEVAGAFLLDDSGKAVAKAVLVAPVKVGGGRNVKLPSGTLMFEKPAVAKAA